MRLAAIRVAQLMQHSLSKVRAQVAHGRNFRIGIVGVMVLLSLVL